MTDLFMADGFMIKPGEWQISPTSLFEFSPGQGLDEIMAEYQDKLFVVMQDYLYSSDPVTAYRNEFNRYINEAFTFSFVAGWADAGASALTDEAQSVLSGLIASEIQFADSLFTQLKTLREDDEIPMDDKMDAAHAHAEGYTQTLVGVYAEGKMMGEPNRDGKWEIGATEISCDTCKWLAQQDPQPLSWYLKNGYIPREAGSDKLMCGGWQCDCSIVDPKTGEQLIP